jgi:hypothetical protein
MEGGDEMNRPKIGWWLCCGLGFAALQSAAAMIDARSGEESTNPASARVLIAADAATVRQAADEPAAPTSTPGNSKQSPAHKAIPKSNRLKFRGPDGTCACDCASGGISEADIRKSEEARRSASR